MEDQNEQIMRQMEETRTSLTEKLEALEGHIADKVQAGADVVDRTTEAAASIVDNVKEAVHEVTEKVEESVQSVISAFDLRKQTERHPWLVVGVAATTGCILGSMLKRRAAQPVATPAQAIRPAHDRRSNGHGNGNGNGSSHRPVSAPAARSDNFWKQEWFGDQVQRLRGLALGTLLSAVRDLAKRSVPGPVGERIAEEIENFTSHLGAEPIRGPVLSEQQDAGATPAENEKDQHVATNRLRAGGSGTALR